MIVKSFEDIKHLQSSSNLNQNAGGYSRHHVLSLNYSNDQVKMVSTGVRFMLKIS